MTADSPSPTAPRVERSPGRKLLMAILVGLSLSIPLLAIYLLVYDRQSQSDTATRSIVEGWGGAQTVAGPVLVIPYQAPEVQTVEEGGKQVRRTVIVAKEFTLWPETASVETRIDPEERERSIYRAIVFEAEHKGRARFVLPNELARAGIPIEALEWNRAELRFGLSDTRGLFGRPAQVRVGSAVLKPEPGHGPGATGGSGFFTWLDAASLRTAPIDVSYDFRFRGNGGIALAPRAGETNWKVASAWPSPSFSGNGGFLPVRRDVRPNGFDADYQIDNLALGQSLINGDDRQVPEDFAESGARAYLEDGAVIGFAAINLVQPVDLYDQVTRAAKYGFLFIGFTFVAFLMFDLIGGVRVSAVEYLLVGAGLVLFFALLLGFAEVIGFTFAYIMASAAIIGLISAYAAAVLKSWQRARIIGGLLVGLYAVLYILISLEGYSLLIGSLMLFAALAGVMYATRNLDWGAPRQG